MKKALILLFGSLLRCFACCVLGFRSWWLKDGQVLKVMKFEVRNLKSQEIQWPFLPYLSFRYIYGGISKHMAKTGVNGLLACCGFKVMCRELRRF